MLLKQVHYNQIGGEIIYRQALQTRQLGVKRLSCKFKITLFLCRLLRHASRDTSQRGNFTAIFHLNTIFPVLGI